MQGIKFEQNRTEHIIIDIKLRPKFTNLAGNLQNIYSLCI